MGLLRRQARDWLVQLTGCDLERHEGRSLALVDQRHRGEAWYSHGAQLRAIFERCAIDLVVDVGANAGQFAHNLRDFYAGKILSFEPVSGVFERLARRSAADPHWHVYPVACGSCAMTCKINVTRESVFSSLLAANSRWAPSFRGQMQVCEQQEIRVRRLDDLLDDALGPESKRSIFLKLDTQGYDLEAFHGLGEKLGLVAAMQAEVSLIPIYEGMPHWTESVRQFEQAGFGVVAMFPVTRDRDSGRVIEFDCCLVRGDGRLRPYLVESPW